MSVVQPLCRGCINEQDERAFGGRSRRLSLPAFLTVLIQPMAIAACQAVHAPAVPVGDRACAQVKACPAGGDALCLPHVSALQLRNITGLTAAAERHACFSKCWAYDLRLG